MTTTEAGGSVTFVGSDFFIGLDSDRQNEIILPRNDGDGNTYRFVASTSPTERAGGDFVGEEALIMLPDCSSGTADLDFTDGTYYEKK